MTPSQKKGFGHYCLPAVVVLFGLLSIALLIAVNMNVQLQGAYNVYLDVAHEVQIDVLKSHRMLEDMSAGVLTNTPETALGLIDKALGFLDTLQTGGISPHDKKVTPLIDSELLADVDELRTMVKDYRALVLKGLPGGLSGAPAIEHDRMLSRFLRKALLFDIELERRNAASEQRVGRILAAVFVSWSLVTVLAAAGLVQRELRRRRDEKLILHAKKEWERTFDALSDLIMIIDKDHTIKRVNRAMAEYLGLSPAGMIGRKCFELMHGMMGPVSQCPHTRLLKNWSENTAEIYDDTRGRHFRVTVSPVFSADGSLVGSVHVAHDVTEQKRMDEAMRIKDSAIASSVTAFSIADLDGRVSYVNDAFLRLWGFKAAGEVIGRPAVEFGPDSDTAQEVLDVVRQEGAWTGERIAKRKDGSLFEIEMAAHLVTDAAGKPVCMMASIVDITKRKEAERSLETYQKNLEYLVSERTNELSEVNLRLIDEIQEKQQAELMLRESEAKYRKLSQEFDVILNAIPDSLMLLSPDLNVVWANRAAFQTVGSGGSLTGRSCSDVWHHAREGCAECPVTAAFRSGKPEQAQISVPGGSLWAIRAYPIVEDGGGVNSVIQVGTDITEKVNLQAERMRAMHLAALGELAAGVAHEINNPINGIINYAQIILNISTRESKEREIATRIMSEGGRIASIVRSLLSFARDRREDKTPCPPSRILLDTLALTDAQLRKNNIILQVDFPDDLPPVLVNVQQIQQVFLNIVNNARYALNERYPEADPDKLLGITARSASVEGEDYLRVVFEDHGTGIPPAFIDKVMNPFFTTKPAGVGTGLGLSISHGIIIDHKGRMNIETIEGRFTRVIIDLPVLKKEA